MTDQAHEIYWEYLDGGACVDIWVGDLVSADAGDLPVYRVMGLKRGRAWLRDIDTHADRITALRGLYWKGRESRGAGVRRVP